MKIDKPATLEQGALNKVPEFVNSVVDNPVAEMLKGRTNINRFLRLAERKIIDVEVPKKYFLFPPGIMLAGVVNYSFDHNKKKRVFPFVYSPLLEENLAVSGIRADQNKIYVDISNFNAEDKSVKLVIYIYELYL